MGIQIRQPDRNPRRSGQQQGLKRSNKPRTRSPMTKNRASPQNPYRQVLPARRKALYHHHKSRRNGTNHRDFAAMPPPPPRRPQPQLPTHFVPVARPQQFRPIFSFLSLDKPLPTPRPRPRTSGDSVEHSDLGSTTHNKNRRLGRGISKLDLKKARRYGMKEYGRFGRLKYTYQGKVLIWDPHRNKAVTCWTLDKGRNSQNAPLAGTRFTVPIMIHKEAEFDTPRIRFAHVQARHELLHRPHEWKSHTVVVVDMSGSMRMDDCNGARCRSDAVWTVLARDLVQETIQKYNYNGQISHEVLFNMVSVVLMRDQAHVALECEPMNYVLYNKLVELREWTSERPWGHGYYRTALRQAETLLKKNTCGSCVLNLFICSDGRPSDGNVDELLAMVGNMASRFGRRLTLNCLGMADRTIGNGEEEFSVLRRMVEEAREYGVTANFKVPEMDTNALSQFVTANVTSSLSSSVSELSEFRTGQSLVVRSDLVRERRSSSTQSDDRAPDSSTWRLFPDPSKPSFTVNVYKYNENNGGLCRLIDPRCVGCRVQVVVWGLEDTQTQDLCVDCGACYLCSNCRRTRKTNEIHPLHWCQRLAQERRTGKIVREYVPSFNVAWKKSCFGEGAERVAFRFRFLANDFNPIGPTMVAKESRFAEKHRLKVDVNNGVFVISPTHNLTQHQHEYHMNFVRTQRVASKYSELWNSQLQQWEDHAENEAIAACIQKYPRIHFLQLLIFELKEGAETYNVLVEPFIEGHFKKYNTNNGRLLMNTFRVKQQSPTSSFHRRFAELLSAPSCSHRAKNNSNHASTTTKLETVEEGEEDSDNNDEDEIMELALPRVAKPRVHATRTSSMAVGVNGDMISDYDFMNAFSHFTYVHSTNQLMVVDLQGNFVTHNNGTREFFLTDPAIHTTKRTRGALGPHHNFGRTNRGRRGIAAFLDSHKCNGACRLFGLDPAVAT